MIYLTLTFTRAKKAGCSNSTANPILCSKSSISKWRLYSNYPRLLARLEDLYRMEDAKIGQEDESILIRINKRGEIDHKRAIEVVIRKAERRARSTENEMMLQSKRSNTDKSKVRTEKTNGKRAHRADHRRRRNPKTMRNPRKCTIRRRAPARLRQPAPLCHHLR